MKKLASKLASRYPLAAGPAGYVILVLVLFSILTPSTFLTVSNFRAILDQATVPLIVVSGLTFVVLIGSIDLSVEGVMATCALTFVLTGDNSRNHVDLGIWAAVLTVLVGAGFGLVNGLLHVKLKIPSFMVTLGTWFIGLGIGTVLYGAEMPIINDQTLRGWVSHSGAGISNGALFALACVAFSILIGNKTKLGRFAYAIGANENIARLNSIPVAKYKIAIFVYAGAVMGIASVIAASRLGVGTADVGSGQLFFDVAAIIVGGTFLSGGRGGIANSACGVMMLVVVNNGLIHIGASPIVQQALAGLVIVIAVVITGLSERSLLRVVK